MNITEEYEKIFGIPRHPYLFDSADGYDELRQSIINAPQVHCSFEKLPFDGIEIVIKPKRKRRKRISTREKEMVISCIISALQCRGESNCNP